MCPRHPRYTLTDTRCPDRTLVRSCGHAGLGGDGIVAGLEPSLTGQIMGRLAARVDPDLPLAQTADAGPLVHVQQCGTADRELNAVAAHDPLAAGVRIVEQIGRASCRERGCQYV